jgi:ubiquinone/menaquinone biosynthesis C-methylase UbiE
MSDIDQQRKDEQEKFAQVQSRFGAAAADYATSKVHASGQDLHWLVEAAELTGKERVLDVATGAGHTAFALAPGAAEVVALDLTRPMLDVARKGAEERQCSNITFLEANTQAIPCPAGSFDVVSCRQAPHHFTQVQQAVHEWARVLKRGGKLLLVDSISPEEPELAAFLHEIESLRDPSHVYNHPLSQWRIFLTQAGFTVTTVREMGIVLEVPDWTRRMRTPPESVARIEELLRTASPAARERFHIQEQNGELIFTLTTVFMVGVLA